MKNIAHVSESMTVVDNWEEESETEAKIRRGNPAWHKGMASPNPSGRTKGSTSFKEYAKRWFLELPDDQKEAYLLSLEDKRPGFALVMAEGNPTEDKQISLKVPTPILGGVSQLSPEQQQALQAGAQKAIEGEIAG